MERSERPGDGASITVVERAARCILTLLRRVGRWEIPMNPKRKKRLIDFATAVATAIVVELIRRTHGGPSRRRAIWQWSYCGEFASALPSTAPYIGKGARSLAPSVPSPAAAYALSDRFRGDAAAGSCALSGRSDFIGAPCGRNACTDIPRRRSERRFPCEPCTFAGARDQPNRRHWSGEGNRTPSSFARHRGPAIQTAEPRTVSDVIG